MNHLLPFEWIAAVRFLREGRLQTMFIIGGIAIGVGVIVFMSAMLAGLEANFIKRVLTSQPQIQILPPDQVARALRGSAGDLEDATIQRPSQRILSIDQWPKIREQLRAMPEVTAVSPTMSGSALAVRGDASRAISVSGVEPDSYFKIVRIPDYVVAGQPRLTFKSPPMTSSRPVLSAVTRCKGPRAQFQPKITIHSVANAGGTSSSTASHFRERCAMGNSGSRLRKYFVRDHDRIRS